LLVTVWQIGKEWKAGCPKPFFHLNLFVMPIFDLTINVLAFLGFLLLAALAGFALRSRQLAKRDRAIAELESEVAQVSAEILEVQKEYCQLQAAVKDIPSPVISIKNRTA
jgi:septal ring factor EnvC (AmiA/AmiB activator)